jgi:hypothetical protein
MVMRLRIARVGCRWPAAAPAATAGQPCGSRPGLRPPRLRIQPGGDQVVLRGVPNAPNVASVRPF